MARYISLIADIYERNNLPRVFPVNLVAIAKALGYNVYNFKIDPTTSGVSGAVAYDDKAIFINPSEIQERQRFTLAHEIGHIVLGHEKYGNRLDLRDDLYGVSHDAHERAANEFAAELLMPAFEFKRVWDAFKSDRVLADFFCVSGAAVAVRKQRLDLC